MILIDWTNHDRFYFILRISRFQNGGKLYNRNVPTPCEPPVTGDAVLRHTRFLISAYCGYIFRWRQLFSPFFYPACAIAQRTSKPKHVEATPPASRINRNITQRRKNVVNKIQPVSGRSGPCSSTYLERLDWNHLASTMQMQLTLVRAILIFVFSPFCISFSLFFWKKVFYGPFLNLSF